MPVVSKEVVLTQDCVATIAEQLQLTLPATVASEPVSYDASHHARRRESAYAELAKAGLLDGTEPSEAFVTSLRVLCRGAAEFFGYVQTTDRHYNLHVACQGPDAVFVSFARGEVLLRPTRPESMLSQLLAALPQAGPAGGRSLSAREDELRHPDARARTEGRAPRGDARRILELFGEPRSAGGQLRAAVRTGVDGHRTKSPTPIGFLDVHKGRWLTYATDDGTGGTYVTAAPGRTDTIAGKLHEAHQRLRPGAR